MDSVPPKTHAAVTGKGSAWRKYADVMVGTRCPFHFLYYEWCAALANCPGAPGMALRALFWPRLFGSCGRGAQFGQGIVLRHPRRIHLGARVVIAERCVLDARSPELDRAIVLEDDVMLSVGVLLSCKGGGIAIGSHAGIGPGAVIKSLTGEPVSIGRDGILGAGCVVVGGGDYETGRTDIPMRLQGHKPSNGTRVGEDVWMGARCVVLGGVTVGRGSIVGAGAVVTRDVPPLSVCAGVPARVIRSRAPAPAAGAAG